MRKELDNYIKIHKPAFICQIGMFRDLLQYNGFNISYAMCFGISGSMGFAYGAGDKGKLISPDYVLPSYMASPIMPLSIAIDNMCRASNVWAKNSRTSSKETLFKIIKEYINEGKPVVVEVESMEYFQMLGVPSFTVEKQGATKFAIGGHVVSVVGYDEENEELTIVEAFLKGPLKVNKDAFLSCCIVQNSFVAPEGEWSVYYVPSKIMPIEYMIYHGIRRMVHQLLYPYQINENYHFGIDGIKKFFEDILNWSELMDEHNYIISLLLLYNFERMEHSKGLFRNLYAAFLREAGELLENNQLIKISSLYQALAVKWVEVANIVLEMINSPYGPYTKKTDACYELFDQILIQERQAALLLENVLKEWR